MKNGIFTPNLIINRHPMFKKAATACFILTLSAILSACMSLGNLSYKQAKMLKKEGFTLTQDGWTLALPEHLLFNFDDYQIKEHQQIQHHAHHIFAAIGSLAGRRIQRWREHRAENAKA